MYIICCKIILIYVLLFNTIFNVYKLFLYIECYNIKFFFYKLKNFNHEYY